MFKKTNPFAQKNKEKYIKLFKLNKETENNIKDKYFVKKEIKKRK